MKKIKIKCQYCGRQYTPANERDCCPACGAFNEFNMVQSQPQQINVPNTTVPVQPKRKTSVLSVFGGIMLFFLVIGLIAGDDESSENNSSYNDNYYDSYVDYDDSSNKDDDYKKPASTNKIYTETVTLSDGTEIVIASGAVEYKTFDSMKDISVKGSFDELYDVAMKMDDYQFGWLETLISTNCKIESNGTTIYIDDIQIQYYGHNSNINVDIDIESTNQGTKPGEVELYFVKGDVKDRLRANSYSFCYKDEIEDMRDVFTYKGTLHTYWDMSSANFKAYDTLEVIIDGTTFEFDLKYNDTSTELTYYPIK